MNLRRLTETSSSIAPCRIGGITTTTGAVVLMTFDMSPTMNEAGDDAKRKAHGIVTGALEVINQRGEIVVLAEHLLPAKRR